MDKIRINHWWNVKKYFSGFCGIFNISLFQWQGVCESRILLKVKSLHIAWRTSALLYFLTGSRIFWKLKSWKIFVTENRNQAINRNQSMWRVGKGRKEGGEYLWRISFRNAFESGLWGWVYRISDVRFTIFSILNSFRFTSKLKSRILTSGIYRSRGRALIANSIQDFWKKKKSDNWIPISQFDICNPVEYFWQGPSFN